MFTGIVQSVGTVKRIEKKEKGFRFFIFDEATATRVQLGSSVSVSGVCLTVADIQRETMMFDVMPETVRKTTLAEKKEGDAVNLEPSLRMGDEVGGHFVFGHVDCTGMVRDITKDGDNWLVTFDAPEAVRIYMAPQGTISVDGVSLTIARLGEDWFTVSLVEYTWKHTTLSFLKKADKVNLEADMLAKYVTERIKGIGISV